jgi:hypothetical protein
VFKKYGGNGFLKIDFASGVDPVAGLPQPGCNFLAIQPVK